jgi:hypothetical protein
MKGVALEETRNIVVRDVPDPEVRASTHVLLRSWNGSAAAV